MFHERFFTNGRFFHGFRHESPFGKGDLKYVILDLLKDKPRYGYEIIRALEEKSHGFYKPSPGVVYPTLQMLEEMGYASSTDRDGKKVYTITENGLSFLKDKKEFAEEVQDHMRHHWNPDNFDTIGKIMREFAKLRNSIGPRIKDVDPEKLERIHEVIKLACREIESIVQE